MANYGLSSAQYKYGTGSFYSPYASTSRSKALLITPSTGDFKIASGQDFIISLWVQYGDTYVGTANATYPLITFGSGGFDDGWSIGYRVGPNLGFGALPYFRYNGNTINTVFNGTNGDQISPTENGWSHIVAKRASGVITLTFTNTSAVPVVSTANYSGAIGATATGGAYVGASNPVIAGGNNGAYIDELFFARGVSTVQRTNPTLGSINDGSLSTTVFLYQFDGNYYDDETGVQEFSSAISSASTISASLTPILSLKTATASLNSAFTLTGEIRPVPGTIAFSSTDNSQFSLTATLTKIYRIPPTVVNNSTGMFLDNISIDSSVKKFGTGSYKNSTITTARLSLNVLGYGNGKWLAFNSDYTKVFVSTDSGATWSVNSTSGITAAPSKVVYLNDYWIATSGALAWASSNGTGWTSVQMPTGYTAIASSITYANNYWNMVAYSPSAVSGGIIYVYRSAGQDATPQNISPSFGSNTGRVEIGYNARTSLNSVAIVGVAVSGTVTKFTLVTQETVSGASKYNNYIYTSSNNTTWTIDASIVQASTFQIGYGSIATDGSNNWITSYDGTTSAAGEVYTKAGAGAWTKKTKAGVTSVSTGVRYGAGKWWVTFDSNAYSSSDLGTTWTITAYGNALGTNGVAGAGQLAVLDDQNTIAGSGSEVKFISTTDGTTWTNSRITGQINLPETIEYTAGDLSAKYSTWKTMDFWVYTTTPSVSNWLEQSAIAHGNGYNLAQPNTWTVSVGNQVPATDRGFLRIDFANQSAQLSTGNFTNNAWHHVRISRNGLNTAIYLDGTRIATGTLSTALPTNTNPLIFGGFKSTGATNYYFDEFYLSETLLTDTTVTSFTVPTIAWASNASTSLLLHFNGDLTDDISLPPSADLISRSTVAVTANVNYSARSTISSSTQITATAYRVKEIVLSAFSNASMTTNASVKPPVRADANISSSFTLVARIGKLQEIALTAFSNASMTTNAISYKPTAATLSSSSTLVAEGSKVRNAAASLASNAQIQPTASRTRNVSVNLNAFVSTITIDTATKALTVSITSSSSLAINCVKIARINAGLTTTTQVLAAVTRTRSATSTISSNFALAATQVRGRNANANLNAIAALATTPVKTVNAQINLTAFVTELVASENIKHAQANLTTAFVLQAIPKITRTITSQLTARAQVSATVIKVSNITLALASSSTVAASISRNRQAASALSTRATLTANSIRIRSASIALNALFAEITIGTRAGPGAADLQARFALACTTGVIRKAHADLSTTVLWSYIYDKTIPLNQAGDFWIIPADTRLYVIPESISTWAIEPDSRTYIIELDVRDYIISPAGTEFTIEG